MNLYKPEGLLLSTVQNQEYTATREGLERAMERGAILEGVTVLCDHELNLHVSLGHLRGIIPHDQVQYNPDGTETRDIAILTRVGKPTCFKVIGFRRGAGGETVPLLSRREAQRECAETYIASLVPGDIIPARITHMENFGAFVDIGCGMISLLSIDCISVSRISHPAARLRVGETIYTVIRSIDEWGRIYVSERELLGNWEQNAARFTEGETVQGIIRSIESYGVFVELAPNLAGLAEYRADVRVGQRAAVYIKSIIPEKMKVKLVIIDAHDVAEGQEWPPSLEYFIDPCEVTHLDAWRYSPLCCARVIGTTF